jgi:hypothetical protein
VGGLLLLAGLTLSVTFRSWRDAKRSPYFFLRVQAAKRMQRYLLATLTLILLLVITTAYAWQTPQVTNPPLARLSNLKPALRNSVAVGNQTAAEAAPASVEINTDQVSNRIIDTPPELTDPLLELSLPEQYDQFDAAVDLNESTEIGQIDFSTEISEDYEAVSPGSRFGEGFFTLYATFDYEEMADGMTWSWVWRHNGSVVDGGNQLWSYGDNGPGYVYFKPEEGFQLGEYSLEVWVNGELMAQSDFNVTDSISASN